MGEVKQLQPYEVVEFSWGTAVRHRNGKWENIFIRPGGQEIDASELDVVLRDNGIEFVR